MKGSLLSHPHRKNSLHILTLDAVLADDICARLADDPRTKYAQRVAPLGRNITVANLEALAKGTVHSRVIILDVRSLTLPRLMNPYNMVIGYNRQDINEHCYTILIGDGPHSLFATQHSFDSMAGMLARFRIDFHPAVFFFDPFGHYPHDERVGLQLDAQHGWPDGIPKRLAKWFAQDDLRVDEVRKYFRASSSLAAMRQAAKAKRTQKLRLMLEQRIAELAPGQEEQLLPILSKTGLKVQGETLPVNTYPLFFEDWVVELMQRRPSQADKGTGPPATRTK
jgi:hypothetical protein